MGWRRAQFVLLGLIMGSAFFTAHAEEDNLWPLYVKKTDSVAGRPDQINSLGPFISETGRDGMRIVSLRPFYTSFENLENGNRSSYLLYPLIHWRDRGEVNDRGGFRLVQSLDYDSTENSYTQVFPFYFHNKTGDPERDYLALWPFAGTVKNKLWRDEIKFVAWPLYVRTVRDDEIRTHTPYPFIQNLSGPKSSGFGFWPFYGHFEREGDYDKTYALWPFYYNEYHNLDEETPYQRLGVLPFYTRETAAGLKSETFAWPFFGYTREEAPRKEYWENRYFWPFFVQADGEKRTVNRWMPFYTHETKQNVDKRWYMWPLLKRKTFQEPGYIRDRTSILYFLYREEKRIYSDATAMKSTLWPLYGYYDSGTGHKQLQVLDPLTSFFPRNEKVRENWTPLFTLYRYDERSGNRRHSLLWDFIVWEKDETGTLGFYLGPLFQWEAGGDWELLRGLMRRTTEDGGKRTRFFWKQGI